MSRRGWRGTHRLTLPPPLIAHDACRLQGDVRPLCAEFGWTLEEDTVLFPKNKDNSPQVRDFSTKVSVEGELGCPVHEATLVGCCCVMCVEARVTHVLAMTVAEMSDVIRSLTK